MTFVLIHGGNTTGACWKRLPGLLAEPAIAPDLPGRPGNAADLESITVDGWARSVIAAMDRAEIRRGVLTGHSLGGLTVLALARMVPERVRRLVFIACPIPPEGRPVREVLRSGHKEGIDKAEARQGETARQSGEPDEEPDESFEGNRSQGRRAEIREPLGPFVEPISLAGLRQGIPCTYIKLLRDQSLLPSMQDSYIETIRGQGSCDVIELDAPHMAMTRRPRELARILSDIV